MREWVFVNRKSAWINVNDYLSWRKNKGLTNFSDTITSDTKIYHGNLIILQFGSAVKKFVVYKISNGKSQLKFMEEYTQLSSARRAIPYLATKVTENYKWIKKPTK